MHRQRIASTIKEKKYRYFVQCWLKPQSGFDMAHKNFLLAILDKAFESNSEEINSLRGQHEELKKKTEGLVLYGKEVETNFVVKDAEKQLMPEIRKENPEALLFSWVLEPSFE